MHFSALMRNPKGWQSIFDRFTCGREIVCRLYTELKTQKQSIKQKPPFLKTSKCILADCSQKKT